MSYGYELGSVQGGDGGLTWSYWSKATDTWRRLITCGMDRDGYQIISMKGEKYLWASTF